MIIEHGSGNWGSARRCSVTQTSQIRQGTLFTPAIRNGVTTEVKCVRTNLEKKILIIMFPSFTKMTSVDRCNRQTYSTTPNYTGVCFGAYDFRTPKHTPGTVWGTKIVAKTYRDRIIFNVQFGCYIGLGLGAFYAGVIITAANGKHASPFYFS